MRHFRKKIFDGTSGLIPFLLGVWTRPVVMNTYFLLLLYIFLLYATSVDII